MAPRENWREQFYNKWKEALNVRFHPQRPDTILAGRKVAAISTHECRAACSMLLHPGWSGSCDQSGGMRTSALGCPARLQTSELVHATFYVLLSDSRNCFV